MVDLKAWIRDVPDFPIPGIIFRDITPLLRDPQAFRRALDALEYGVTALEVHEDALRPGQRVVLVDDVIATGGTLAATRRLVERLGASVVGVACLIELTALNGRQLLDDAEFFAVVRY